LFVRLNNVRYTLLRNVVSQDEIAFRKKTKQKAYLYTRFVSSRVSTLICSALPQLSLHQLHDILLSKSGNQRKIGIHGNLPMQLSEHSQQILVYSLRQIHNGRREKSNQMQTEKSLTNRTKMLKTLGILKKHK